MDTGTSKTVRSVARQYRSSIQDAAHRALLPFGDESCRLSGRRGIIRLVTSDRDARRLPPPWSLPWFWKAQAAGWLVYFIGGLLSELASEETGSETILASMPFQIVRVTLGFLISSGLAVGLQRLPSVRANPRRFVGFALLGAAVAGAVWYPSFRVMSHPWRPAGVGLLEVSCFFPCLLEHIWLMLTWTVLFLAVTELQLASAREQDTLRAERLASEARYQMLVYQVNPHFLFNALNSIRALATEDVMRAREMITQLSAFLRHTLADRSIHEVALSREVDSIAAYLAIEKVRHEELLQIRVDIADDLRDVQIPGFLLHPLVENAITHGFRVPDQVLYIDVRARRDSDRLILEVANSGTLTSARTDGTGIGLRNVKERIAHRFGSRAEFRLEETEGVVVARITMPLETLETPP